MGIRLGAVVVAVAISMLGCGGATDDASDAGLIDATRVDAAGADATAPWLDGAPSDVLDIPMPLSPAIARLPVLTPCPAGWLPLATDPPSCDPRAIAPLCPSFQARYPGEPACVAVGTPCPADGVPTGLPAGRPIVYVRAGATRGNGTRPQPYGTIALALQGAVSGTIIALTAGQLYDESVVLPSGITLWGGCASATVIEPANLALAVRIGGPGAALRNLSLGGGIALEVPAATSVQLDDVVLRPMLTSAVIYGTVTARNLSVESPGVSVPLGLQVFGRLSASRLAIAESWGNGILVTGAGSSAEVSDVAVLRNVRGPGSRAVSLEVAGGGVLFVRRGVSAGGEDVGVRASGTGSRLELEDVVIAEPTPKDGTGPTLAVDVSAGATVIARRTKISNTGGAGIEARTGAVVDLSQVWIIGTTSPAVNRMTVRVDGAELRAAALAIDSGRSIGLSAGLGARLNVDDLVVRGPASEPAAAGILLGPLADARLTRVRLSATGGYALYASGRGGATNLEVSDLTVTDTRSFADGQGGGALLVAEGALVIARRLSLLRNRAFGAVAAWNRARLELFDVTIDDVTPPACAPGCGAISGAAGIGAYFTGTVTATAFAVSRSTTCGIQVGGDSSVDLENGVVHDNPVGANVQVPGYDFNRLGNRVIYRDNGSNIDTNTLPLPIAPLVP